MLNVHADEHMRLSAAHQSDTEHRSDSDITDLFHDPSSGNAVRRVRASVEKDSGRRE